MEHIGIVPAAIVPTTFQIIQRVNSLFMAVFTPYSPPSSVHHLLFVSMSTSRRGDVISAVNRFTKWRGVTSYPEFIGCGWV